MLSSVDVQRRWLQWSIFGQTEIKWKEMRDNQTTFKSNSYHGINGWSKTVYIHALTLKNGPICISTIPSLRVIKNKHEDYLMTFWWLQSAVICQWISRSQPQKVGDQDGGSAGILSYKEECNSYILRIHFHRLLFNWKMFIFFIYMQFVSSEYYSE